jgi:hypothetical protein
MHKYKFKILFKNNELIEIDSEMAIYFMKSKLLIELMEYNTDDIFVLNLNDYDVKYVNHILYFIKYDILLNYEYDAPNYNIKPRIPDEFMNTINQMSVEEYFILHKIFDYLDIKELSELFVRAIANYIKNNTRETIINSWSKFMDNELINYYFNL